MGRKKKVKTEDFKFTRVYLHGSLAEKYSADPILVSVNSWTQLFSYLEAVYPRFRSELCKYESLSIGLKNDGKTRFIPQDELMMQFGHNDEIHLIAIPKMSTGAEAYFATWASSWAAAAGASAATATFVYAAAYVVAVIAISYAVSAVMKSLQSINTSSSSSAASVNSNMFSGPENIAIQGSPTPLIYGRVFVGSVTVNQDYKTIRVSVTKNTTVPMLGVGSGSINIFADDYGTADNPRITEVTDRNGNPVVLNSPVAINSGNGSVGTVKFNTSGVVEINVTQAADACKYVFNITATDDKNASLNQTFTIEANMDEEHWRAQWNIGSDS